VLGDRATIRTAFRYSDARGRSVGQIVYGLRDTGTAYNTKDLAWHLNFEHRLTPRFNHSALVGYFRTKGLSADTIADPTTNVYAILDGTPGAIFPNGPRLVRLLDKPTFDAIAGGAQSLSGTQFLATTPFGAGFGDFPFTSSSEVRRPAVKYQADYTWGDSHVLTAGYDFERESTSLNGTYRIQNHAYFVQQQFTFKDRWFATLGGRVDDNSRIGTNASPKLSVGGYLLPSGSGPLSSVKVFANLGRGLKNPTFSELFGGPFNDGNPDLKPERARTVDAGAELTFAARRFYTRIAYFDNRFTDQVAFKSSGPGLDGRADYINIDGSKATGWEIEGALERPVAGMTAGASYALVDTAVVSSVSTSEQFQPGQPLLRRPKHSVTARAAYQRGPAAVHLDLRYVGDRHDASFIGLAAVRSARFPTGRSVDITVNPGYTVVGVGAEGRVRDDMTIFVRIDNIADTVYESALGFPGLPRAAVVGARVTVGGR
jgi:outer membrane receptor protein involved in Fe transport